MNPLFKLIGNEYSKLFIRVYTSDEPLNELGLTNIMELSALRAQTIATLITEIQGVSNEKLMPIGYGSYFYNSDNFKRKIDDFIEFDIYSLWESTVKDINNR